MFRDLLVHVDGSQAGRRRVQLAVDLAGRMDARLSGLHATPPAEVPLKYKPSRLAEVTAHVSARLALDALAAAAIFSEEAPDACWFEASGDVVVHISDKARYADLVILGQYEAQGIPERHPLPIAHSVVLRCGRPVLVVPDVAQPTTLARAAIAWTGSREAVRAVHDALPLLQLSRSVQIVRVGGPSDNEGDELDAKRLSAHLTNHGIEVEANTLSIKASKKNEVIAKLIEEEHYDLWVMGGYSRPMWRQFIFGGGTQSVLLSSIIPVFVSH
jgi:nucleotide-binding universal stress UspA family protein